MSSVAAYITLHVLIVFCNMYHFVYFILTEACPFVFVFTCVLKIWLYFCPGKRKPQSFMCEECGKIFNRADLLRNHKRVHSGDKPFTCEVCGDKFRELGHLRRHMTRHTGLTLICIFFFAKCKIVY